MSVLRLTCRSGVGAYSRRRGRHAAARRPGHGLGCSPAQVGYCARCQGLSRRYGPGAVICRVCRAPEASSADGPAAALAGCFTADAGLSVAGSRRRDPMSAAGRRSAAGSWRGTGAEGCTRRSLTRVPVPGVAPRAGSASHSPRRAAAPSRPRNVRGRPHRRRLWCRARRRRPRPGWCRSEPALARARHGPFTVLGLPSRCRSPVRLIGHRWYALDPRTHLNTLPARDGHRLPAQLSCCSRSTPAVTAPGQVCSPSGRGRSAASRPPRSA
ncbi:hypothetical protein K376_01276 [Streptomyces sp. PsTaAH-130]|nr:hypothetical protein K376_01276 [Streptomyces sp. PsTaAH-130]